jgi:short-subunit dehydrogenase
MTNTSDFYLCAKARKAFLPMKHRSKNKTALITGASAGIGLEMAELHAKEGGHLILVARREERLKKFKKKLEAKYQVDVHVIAKDLAAEGAAEEVYAETQKEGLEVDYLINNAGFSQQGYFHEVDLGTHRSIIMVNVMAMVDLAHFFLKDMVERKEGKILFVASSAAFAPGGPMQSIYYATKAFLVSFSQGLAGELEGSGVTTTVLCPGATKTEFEQVSGLDRTELFSTEKVFDASTVAREGYEAMLNGKLVKMSALTPINKFVLKNISLFPTKPILKQIKTRQQTSGKK